MGKRTETVYYGSTPDEVYSRIKTNLMNKYYNIFMNSMEWTDLSREQEDYIMRKFWAEGQIAAFDFKAIDDIGFAPFSVCGIGLYDVPVDVLLVNERNIPGIPSNMLKVDKNVVLGYFQRNHKPVKMMVEWYVSRMAQVEMVINTNLELHKMPWVVGVSDQDTTRARNTINKILNNEIVVFMSLDEVQNVQALVTNTPYIIDKLYAYKNNLESELLTYLGIDNSQIDVDKLAVDQINANNQLINSNAKGYEKELKKFCDKIQEVLGYKISVKTTTEPVMSVHQNMNKENSNMEDKNETGGTL